MFTVIDGEKLNVTSKGLPCIKNMYGLLDLLDLMDEYYEDAENEMAFRRWVEERREKEREAGIYDNLCSGILPWEAGV